MNENIRLLAKTIRENQERLRSRIVSMRSGEEGNGIVRKVANCEVSGSVCAVDGGLISHRMHGVDIVLCRAVGVRFIYDKSVLKTHDHHPGRSPESSMEIRNALDEHEANVFKSLVRLKHELTCAISIVERYRPSLLLLDGSLLPVPSDRPPHGSELNNDYKQMIDLYSRLYSECARCSVELIGVIKDSRSTRLSKRFGIDCSDSLFCNYFLEAGERTAEIPYLDESVRDLNKDVAQIAEEVSFFYMKPSEIDLPLRVEILNTKKPVDEKASIIHSLSSVSKAFAYPAILVEADMCAAMDGKELEAIENLLASADVRPLRRNSRPFR